MATRTVPDRKLTYGDYLRFPADRHRHEIIDGEEHVSPPPIVDHQAIVGRLLYQLFARIEDTGLGRVFPAPLAVQLGPHDVVEPDLVVVLAARAEILTPKRVFGSPDLVVEVLSPSTKAYDRGKKYRLYERARVSEYWIVDPKERLVEQYGLAVNRYELLGKHATTIQPRIVACPPIDLSKLF